MGWFSFIIWALLWALMPWSVQGKKSTTIVPVGQAQLAKIHLEVRGPSSPTYGWVGDVFVKNFNFYRKYFSAKKKKRFSNAKSKKVQLKVEDESLVAIYEGEEKKTPFKDKKELRRAIHQASHWIYEKIMGRAPVFLTKIFMVCEDEKIQDGQVKELFSMDYDGHNVKQWTSHGGLVISPAISFDGQKILYSLILPKKKERNLNLYLLDLSTSRSKLISQRKGMNSGAVFMPRDQEILLTMGHQGNADIYRLNLKTGKYVHVTKHYAVDVDPHVTADGRLMAFLSDRPGAAMIYTLNPSGTEKNIRRISWVGQYNATPRFSPSGQDIVFSSWLDNRFDLFRIGHDGRNLVRLTKDFGSNEGPSYSRDGEFIIFTSLRVLGQKRAVKNLYIMGQEGEVLGNVSRNLKNCSSARWSP